MSRAPRGRRAAAYAVWAASWTLATASLLLAWRAGLPTEPLPGVFLSQAPIAMQSRFDDIGATVALIYGPVSALILARRPHPVGVILAVHAVGSGLAAFGVQYGLLGAELPGLPAWGFFAFAAGWGFVPGTFMTAALPLLVARGRVPAWHRAIVGICAVVASAAFLLSLTQQQVTEPRNPFAVDDPAYQGVVSDVYTGLSFAALAISMLTCVILVTRWARAVARDRAGIAWLTLGHVFLTASYLSLVVPAGVELAEWIVGFGMVAPVLGQVLYPAAILVVVLGQRLWGVELVVSRIILWALLTVSGVLLYLLVVLVVPALVPGAGSGGLTLLTPVAIALAVQPLRRWLQGRIDALVYGEGADPVALLARLGDRIGELESGPAGLQRLCEALRRVLRLGGVAVRSTVTPALAASSGRDAGPAVRHPLRAGDRVIGELVVRPRDGQRLDRRTLRLLDDIAGLVAAALQLVESNLVLEQARGDLIALRAEERRAVRRELHDGLGPSLAGIGFGLAAVENLLPAQPAKAEELLRELADDLNRRVRDVRDLANEVTPSPLDGATLGEALDELTARFASADLHAEAIVDAASVLPVAVQDAVYFIAAEALTNAARHAGATHVAIAVSGRAGDAAELRVTDDGAGIATDAMPGVGLRSMRERAEELGGELEVITGPSGTTIHARLPLRQAASADGPVALAAGRPGS